MFEQLQERLSEWERRVRRSFGDDISTPARRRASMWHYQVLDHAILRHLWTNFAPVAPGVYRSNQPTHRRLKKLKAMGITTILNLRGRDRFAHYLFEKESCEALGITLHDAKLYARQPATREQVLAVLEAFKTLPRPFLIHCKSGADRAGFAAALYLLAHEGATVAEARKQLSLRFIHLKWSKTGILDHILDVYEARNAKSPIGIEAWVRTEYDKQALIESYANRRHG